MPGDRVLVRILSARGKHKLQDRWEATPYTITRKVWDLPVYAVKPDGGGKESVLHRNLLLPSRLPEIHIAQERRQTPRVGRTPTLEGNESDGSHQGEDEVVEDLLTPSRPSECQASLNSEAPEITVPEATLRQKMKQRMKHRCSKWTAYTQPNHLFRQNVQEVKGLSKTLENSHLLRDQEKYRSLQNVLELM